MTYLATARKIAPTDFARDFAGKDWSKATWSPKMFVLHNTDEPNLQQWLSGGATPEQRLANLEHYYQGMHWHSGPHWFVAPDAIWEFCDPLSDGVHCSCANHVAFGCEMVGDYATESFSDGPGAHVRDNAVIVMATVFKHFGWTPDPLVLWERGLAFHHHCARDKHACPGVNVDRTDVVRRVLAAMGQPAATPSPNTGRATQVHAPIAESPSAPGSVAWVQNALNKLGADPQVVVDGKLGPLTKAALYPFQFKANLTATGEISPMTVAALQKALVG